SLTLVRDPAWDEASFNVVASTDTAGGLVLPGKYTVLSNNSSPGEKHMTDNNTEGNAPDKNPDGTEIAAIMTENQKLKEDLAALKASLDKLKEERDNASLAAASGIPADKFNEMVEDRAKKLAAVTMEQWKEEQEKNAATQKYTRAVMSAGLEPDRSVLKNLTSEQILNLAASYERLTPLSASRHFNIAYPTENSSLKSSVGRWNEAKKSWEDF
ncbi:MAG: hypothetical protein QCH31_12000, partial [Methanolobus sp.]|nr:hypothetical protein [Methanolobus sp.]